MYLYYILKSIKICSNPARYSWEIYKHCFSYLAFDDMSVFGLYLEKIWLFTVK